MPDYSDIPNKYKGGNCYKEAIDYMIRNHHLEGLLLCHGWVSGRGPIQGVRFSHAWIELDNKICIDPSLRPKKPLELPKDVFYAIANIREERVFKYDYNAMIKMIEKTKKAGPWNTRWDE